MIRQVFPAFRAGEKPKLVFDFSDMLDVGETVSSATASVVLHAGEDSALSAVMPASPTLATPRVACALVLNEAGNIYDLVATAVTSLGKTLKRGGYVAVGG